MGERLSYFRRSTWTAPQPPFLPDDQLERYRNEQHKKSSEFLERLQPMPTIVPQCVDGLQFMRKLVILLQESPVTTVLAVTQLPGSGKTAVALQIERWLRSHPQELVRNLAVTRISLDSIEDTVGQLAVVERDRQQRIHTEPAAEINPILQDILNVIADTEGKVPITEPVLRAQFQREYLESLLRNIPSRYDSMQTGSLDTLDGYQPDSNIFLKFARAALLRELLQASTASPRCILIEMSAGSRVGNLEVRAYPNKVLDLLRQYSGKSVKIAVCSVTPGPTVVGMQGLVRSALQQAQFDELQYLLDIFSVSDTSDSVNGSVAITGGSLAVLALNEVLIRQLLASNEAQVVFGLHHPVLYRFAKIEPEREEDMIIRGVLVQNAETLAVLQQQSPFLARVVLEARAVVVRQYSHLSEPDQFAMLRELIESVVSRVLLTHLLAETTHACEADLAFHAWNDPPMTAGTHTIVGRGILQLLWQRFADAIQSYRSTSLSSLT